MIWYSTLCLNHVGSLCTLWIWVLVTDSGKLLYPASPQLPTVSERTRTTSADGVKSSLDGGNHVNAFPLFLLTSNRARASNQ